MLPFDPDTSATAMGLFRYTKFSDVPLFELMNAFLS
jgi:hypothetical protein